MHQWMSQSLLCHRGFASSPSMLAFFSFTQFLHGASKRTFNLSLSKGFVFKHYLQKYFFSPLKPPIKLLDRLSAEGHRSRSSLGAGIQVGSFPLGWESVEPMRCNLGKGCLCSDTFLLRWYGNCLTTLLYRIPNMEATGRSLLCCDRQLHHLPCVVISAAWRVFSSLVVSFSIMYTCLG